VVVLNGSLKLYSYWRSSAAYRVRIALNLKGLEHEIVPVHLAQGEQHADAFRDINPQQLIPVLGHGQRLIRQSLAIIEYLDETWPGTPMLPATARDRARVRALAQVVACDIHPLNNLRVLQYLEHEAGMAQPAREAWVRHWIELGLGTLEQLLADHPATGEFCEGEQPGLADCCLVPQVYNARRFNVDMGAFPSIQRIDAACRELPEFQAAAPENQPDHPAPVPA
jgi:maleylacetoacetate isomerase